MKINVEIDCTPDEARYFMGLPNLKPMQDAIMGKLEQQLLDTIGNVTPALLRAWLPYWMPFGGMSPEDMQKLISGFMNAATGQSNTGQSNSGTPARAQSPGAKQ